MKKKDGAFFFPFRHKDFFGSARVLIMPDSVKIDYIKLLGFQWDNGSIPDDYEQAAMLCNRSDIEAFKTQWEKHLAPCFEIVSNGRRMNGIMAKEGERYHEIKSINHERAKKAADGRWHGPEQSIEDAPSNAPRIPTHTHTHTQAHDSKLDKGSESGASPDVFAVEKPIYHFFRETVKAQALSRWTDSKGKIIKAAMNRGHDENAIKAAILNFSMDDWEFRPKYSDITQCLGVKDGEDLVIKWVNSKPIRNTGQRGNGKPAPLSDSLAGFRKLSDRLPGE